MPITVGGVTRQRRGRSPGSAYQRAYQRSTRVGNRQDQTAGQRLTEAIRSRRGSSGGGTENPVIYQDTVTGQIIQPTFSQAPAQYSSEQTFSSRYQPIASAAGFSPQPSGSVGYATPPARREPARAEELASRAPVFTSRVEPARPQSGVRGFFQRFGQGLRQPGAIAENTQLQQRRPGLMTSANFNRFYYGGQTFGPKTSVRERVAETGYVLGQTSRNVGEGIIARYALLRAPFTASQATGRAVGTGLRALGVEGLSAGRQFLINTGIQTGIAFGTAEAAARGQRSFERRYYERTFGTGSGARIQAASDAAFERYFQREDVGVGRRLAAGVSTLAVDQTRFGQEFRGELTARGFTPEQASSISGRSTGLLRATRGYGEFFTGIFGYERAGEAIGQGGILFSNEFFISRGRTLTPRQVRYTSRTFIGAAGTVEAGSQSVYAQRVQTGRVSARETAFYAGTGGVFAGFLGGSIVERNVFRPNAASTRALNFGSYVIDPNELPGDIAQGYYTRGLRRAGYFQGEAGFFTNRARTRAAPVVTTTEPFFGSGNGRPRAARSSLPTMVSAPSRSAALTPTRAASFSRTFTGVPALTPVQSLTPARTPARTAIASRTPTDVAVNVNIRTNIPTATRAPTTTRAPTNVPTRTGFLPPFFDVPLQGGGQGRGGSRGRGDPGSFRYTPSLFAAFAGIRRRGRRSPRATGYTGLEIRGI